MGTINSTVLKQASLDLASEVDELSVENAGALLEVVTSLCLTTEGMTQSSLGLVLADPAHGGTSIKADNLFFNLRLLPAVALSLATTPASFQVGPELGSLAVLNVLRQVDDLFRIKVTRCDAITLLNAARLSVVNRYFARFVLIDAVEADAPCYPSFAVSRKEIDASIHSLIHLRCLAKGSGEGETLRLRERVRLPSRLFRS